MLTRNKFIIALTAILTSAMILSGCAPKDSLDASAFEKSPPLFVEAVDFKTIENVPGCVEEPYHKERRYPQCTDPEKLLDAAKDFAVENNLPLAILWGFDGCPGCEDQYRVFFDPDMLPTNKTITSSLTDPQKAEFSAYTNGKNQLAFVRMNSATSLKHVQAFADKIGANDVADSLGWTKVWSPMFMVMNPETNALASNAWFNGYVFCTMGEELALSLEQVGIVSPNPDGKKACYRPADASEDDFERWKADCAQGDFTKCFWAGETGNILYAKDEAETFAEAQELKASAMRMLDRACENGLVTACQSLAYQEPPNGDSFTSEGNALLAKACEQKDMTACSALAIGYYNGAVGIDVDRRKAVELAEMACDSHNPYACAQLGEMAYQRAPGTRPYRLRVKELLDFGCRDGAEWACGDNYR